MPGAVNTKVGDFSLPQNMAKACTGWIKQVIGESGMYPDVTFVAWGIVTTQDGEANLAEQAISHDIDPHQNDWPHTNEETVSSLV